jgi:hypothetical protein
MNYDKVKQIVNDFRFASEKLLKIKDKKGNIIPFKLNNAQNKVYDVYEKAKVEGKPLRFIILKARQEGISTMFEGVIFQRNTFAKNRKALIIGHIKEASDNLFAMFKRFYENLPKELQPEIQNSNEKKISYKRLKSEIVVSTAESGEAGRSATIQDLHATEVAFWRDANTTMTGLLQTVPDEQNTLIVLESTANGIGGYFYDVWQDAISGENGYIPIFLAWHDLPEYSKEFSSDSDKSRFILSDYEKNIQKSFNLTLEQLNWYRHTLINKLNGDIQKMKQEYPSSAQEAFVASGNPVFDTEKCFDNYNLSSEGLKGDLLESGEFIKNSKGFITLYKNIEVSEREENVYSAGVDVAEGLEQGDYSVCKVLDRRTDEVILTWHGHIDPDLFAGELKKIQNLLKNKVFFEIEKNNHGLHVIIKGYELGLNIKYQEDYSKGYLSTSHQGLGFITTSKSKPIIINYLNEWIREDLFTDRDKQFWSECLTFVRDAQGRMAAQGKLADASTKTYDDRVMASALMINCSIWLPNYAITKGNEPIRISEYSDCTLSEVTL